jgi:hypothetical protein
MSGWPTRQNPRSALCSEMLPSSIPGTVKTVFLSTKSWPVLGRTQPLHGYREGGSLSSRVKQQQREANHLSEPTAEGKNGRTIVPLPHGSSWSGA